MTCEFCKLWHDKKYGSGRFCSIKCCRTFSAKSISQEAKNRVKSSLRAYYAKNPDKVKGWKTFIPTVAQENKRIAKLKEYCSLPEIKLAKSQAQKRYYNSTTAEDKLKLSSKLSLALKGKSGGIRRGSGRGCHGYFNGFYVDSTWEAAWLHCQIKQGNTPTRNSRGFTYLFKDQWHKFYPDFILNGVQGVYYEIKGWIDEKTAAKISQFPADMKLVLLTKPDIKPMVQEAMRDLGNQLKFFIKMASQPGYTPRTAL